MQSASSAKYIIKGYVMKRGGGKLSSSWKRRFCCLSTAGILSYYEHEDNMASEIANAGSDEKRGSIDIPQTVCRTMLMPIDLAETQGYTTQMLQLGFFVVSKDRVWHFIAESNKSPKDWIAAIEPFIVGANAFPIRCAGILTKEGGLFASWKQRHFVCSTSHLFYFENRDHGYNFCTLGSDRVDMLPSSVMEIALGIVPLLNARVALAFGSDGSALYEGHAHTFAITPATGDQRTYYIAAESDAVMRSWIAHCKSAAAGEPIVDEVAVAAAAAATAAAAAAATAAAEQEARAKLEAAKLADEERELAEAEAAALAAAQAKTEADARATAAAKAAADAKAAAAADKAASDAAQAAAIERARIAAELQAAEEAAEAAAEAADELARARRRQELASTAASQ